MIKKYIQKLINGENLTENEIIEAMNRIMNGEATQAQIGSFLTALRAKGETVEEITGCTKVMREKSERINPKAEYSIDTCGTGGDGAGTINVSTGAAIIAAAGGASVAKHGNRAASSRSGSADVLEALGVNIQLDAAQVEECINRTGIGFMFAQTFHKSMKHVAGARKELGIRTVFNILGPLTNPASAKGQVLGVYDEKLTEPMAEVLRMLGSERALVIHGNDGLDEISTTGHTKISELKNGEINSYYLDAADFGLERVSLEELKGGDAKENAEILKEVFAGKKGPARDIIVVNAAAALYVAKLADSIKEGVTLAEKLIDSGSAAAKLAELVGISTELGGRKEAAI
ncbi:MAG: anthranilate phosphoribosyltransferase [Clostridiales bacterium]|nr:anthranilate phosphoribosyltransferase [Clostridiales bacterium]